MLRVVILVFSVEPCRRRIERNIQLRIVNHSSHDGAQTRIDHSDNAINNEPKHLIDAFQRTF